jgi:hypothetical protein
MVRAIEPGVTIEAVAGDLLAAEFPPASFDADDIAALLPPDRFQLLTCEVVDLAEVPDAGPVTHWEWLTVARKVRTC